MSQSLEEKKQASSTSSTLAVATTVADSIPGGQPATNWYAWFTAQLPWQQRQEERESLAGRQKREETGLVQAPATYHGRDVAVTDADGKVTQKPVSGTVQREEEQGAFSWLRGVFSWRGGSETHGTAQDGTHTTTTDTRDRTLGLSGGESSSTKGTKTEVLDVKATAGVAKKELDEEQARAKQEVENLRNDKRFGSDAERQAKIDDIEMRIAGITVALDKLAKNPSDGAVLAQICADHKLTVEPKYKVVAEESVTEKDKLELVLWKGKANSSHDKVEKKTADGVTNTTTTKSATGTDLRGGHAVLVEQLEDADADDRGRHERDDDARSDEVDNSDVRRRRPDGEGVVSDERVQGRRGRQDDLRLVDHRDARLRAARERQGWLRLPDRRDEHERGDEGRDHQGGRDRRTRRHDQQRRPRRRGRRRQAHHREDRGRRQGERERRVPDRGHRSR